MYKWLPLSSPADLAQLETVLAAEFDGKSVGDKLMKGISPAVKGVLIEENYIDKDYRSTYYSYYSKKGQRYSADCVRLHFFDQTVSFKVEGSKLVCSDTNPTSGEEQLNDHYFGYMVLRPTGIATIGRTVLTPDIRLGAARFTVFANHKAHVLGRKLTVPGFPSMDQHVDIAVCAHVACWSILRHYSERYAIHREYLTHDITMMAHDFDPGGLLPAKGLQVSHAERVFQKAGTFPIHVSRSSALGQNDLAFYRQLGAYIESGFPVFAAMRSLRHAVAVVGYEWRTQAVKATGLKYSWDEVQALAVIDDNELPYLSVPVSSVPGSAGYSVEDIDAFIVALPEKIYFPADAVDRLAPTLFNLGGPLGLPPQDQTILRYFLTTGSALRAFVRDRESEFDPDLVSTIMDLRLAQFVWVVEFATHAQWPTKQVSARAVIDATASLFEELPLWLFHSNTGAFVFDRNQIGDVAAGTRFVPLKTTGHSGFSLMNQNVRSTQSK
jgi:hypothetical protein